MSQTIDSLRRAAFPRPPHAPRPLELRRLLEALGDLTLDECDDRDRLACARAVAALRAQPAIQKRMPK